ncbi:MAG: c-type cytochrome [Deltaproteobacteria bacterium]|nr:c-type cytochrome [Deltaproteobacteria bacterium]
MLKMLRLGIVFSCFLEFAHALPFNQDMVYVQPKIGEIMRDEPQNSVPKNADSRKFPPVEEALILTNPYKSTVRSVLLGKRLFLANCSQCHGIYLDREYKPGANQGFIYGLDLSTADMKSKPDGHFYSAILYGFPQVGDAKVMPPYRVKFTDYEVWSIVNFIRDMQQKRNH